MAVIHDRVLSCRGILRCLETALDAANDTFLAMLANVDHLDPCHLGDWLVGTAHYLTGCGAVAQASDLSWGLRLRFVSIHRRVVCHRGGFGLGRANRQMGLHDRPLGSRHRTELPRCIRTSGNRLY
jgi:hypothetical protein